MNKQLIAATAILALLGSGAALAGDIYKWVDADGNVHYGDKPIGEQSERVAIESRPTDPSRVASESQQLMASRSTAIERRSEREAAEEEQANLQAEAAAHAERCTSARAQMQRMITARKLYREDEDGEREYLDEAESQAARARIESQINEHCNT